MKAAVRLKYGPPEGISIQELEIPTPKNNEILVRVHAATVNRTDCAGLWGKPFVYRFFTGLFKPRKKSTGTDFAGQVEAVGSGVTAFKPGDRVWGFDDNIIGSHAQYIVLTEKENVLTIPGNTAYEQAAASAEGAHYACNFINKVKINPGDKVMVYGASGAIGSALVQLLKHLGAYVTAVCNTQNVELVKALGPDKVVDYQTEDFTRDEMQYHFVLDAVGKSSFGVCKSLLFPGGVYMSSELGPGGENLYLPLTTRFKSKRVIFPLPGNVKGSLQLVNTLLENGSFTPMIDRKYPLEEIAEAYRYVASGQKTGNVLLTFE